MKKVLAIVLSMIMLLSFCAYAESMDAVVKNLKVFADDTTLFDFSGIELVLGYADQDDTAGVHIALNAADAEVVNLVGAVTAEQIVLTMTGLSDVYTLDLNTVLPVLEMLTSSMPVSVDETGAIELTDADAAIIAEIEALANEIAAGVAVSEEEVNGEACAVTVVTVTPEQFTKLIETAIKLAENHPELTGGEEIGDIEGLEMGIECKTVAGANLSSFDLVMDIVAEGDAVTLGVYGEIVDGWDIFAELSVSAEGSKMGVSTEIDLVEGDAAWLPGELGETVDILTIDDAQIEKLTNEALAVLMGGIGQLAAANETLAGLLMGA